MKKDFIFLLIGITCFIILFVVYITNKEIVLTQLGLITTYGLGIIGGMCCSIYFMINVFRS